MYRIKETVEAVNKIGQLMKDGSSYVNEHPEVCMIPILSQIAISIAVIADCIDGVEDEDCVSVVRCKDCKYYHERQVMNCVYHVSAVCENWFCSQGRVKE